MQNSLIRWSCCVVALTAQKFVERLPGVEWWYEISSPCAQIANTSACTSSISEMKNCVNQCAGGTLGHVNYKLPRRAACEPTHKGIPTMGFIYDLPAETVDPAFTLTTARLLVDTYRLQVLPMWDTCEHALQLVALARGASDDAVMGTNTTTVCGSRRWYMPPLSDTAKANEDLRYFELLPSRWANLTVPHGVSVSARNPTSCLGFSPHTLFLQTSYGATA